MLYQSLDQYITTFRATKDSNHGLRRFESKKLTKSENPQFSKSMNLISMSLSGIGVILGDSLNEYLTTVQVSKDSNHGMRKYHGSLNIVS